MGDFKLISPADHNQTINIIFSLPLYTLKKKAEGGKKESYKNLSKENLALM